MRAPVSQLMLRFTTNSNQQLTQGARQNGPLKRMYIRGPCKGGQLLQVLRRWNVNPHPLNIRPPRWVQNTRRSSLRILLSGKITLHSKSFVMRCSYIICSAANNADESIEPRIGNGYGETDERISDLPTLPTCDPSLFATIGTAH